MNDRLEDFLSSLEGADSVLETWRATTIFLQSLGFDLMMYGYASAETPAKVDTLSNFPANYQQRYREQQYFRDDPVVRHCMENLSPLPVGRECLRMWPDRGRGLTARQRRIVNDAADCGMSVGIVIPLRSPGQYPLAGMSLSNAMRPTEFRRFLEEWGDLAQLAVLHAHIRMQMLLQSPERDTGDIMLPPRGRECLLWVSRGLSSKEIAKKLDLSPKTVDFHLAESMRKLGATTRSHALARAIALGLIQP